MAQRRRTPTHRKELARQVVEQPESRVSLLWGHTGGPLQIADLQCRRARFPRPRHHPGDRLAHDQRRVLRPQEARAERPGTEQSIRGDAHKAR